MTGYQETVTDPSYAEQLVCFTAPMVGNYGVAEERLESDGPHAKAVLMRRLGGSEWAEWLRRHGLVGLEDPPRAAVPPLTPAPPPELPEKPPASEPPAPPSPPQPAYRLTLETWPLAAGVRFLVDSFCPQHGDEYRKLYRSLKDHPLVQADLTELAAALVESCGQEPGFAARGSLLDRVRLALLLSPNEDVPLAVVVERTGLNPRGLHGRIKEKARGWLKIV